MARSTRFLAAGILVSAAVLVGAVASPAAVGQARAACGTITGPAWALPAMGKKGTSWNVSAKGVTCTFAKKWASTLVKTPWRGEATKLLGPAGWSCLARVGGELATKGTSGECRKGAKLFSWGVAV